MKNKNRLIRSLICRNQYLTKRLIELQSIDSQVRIKVLAEFDKQKVAGIQIENKVEIDNMIDDAIMELRKPSTK